MKELKILSIGNSFAMDTMEYLTKIILRLGYDRVKLGDLYIGGCSINRHYNNAVNDAPEYRYYVNDGTGWEATQGYKMSDAITSEKWDWISIQHGTGDGSRYTSEESYEKLLPLIEYVRGLAWQGVKIAFNMAWVGEPYHHHPELASYNGDQLLMYEKLTDLTKRIILPMKQIDCVSPTGTAVQNARTSKLETISRDGYHLTYDTGRYLAGLTFFKALTGTDVSGIEWAPIGVDEYAKKVVIESVENAFLKPFEVTQSTVAKQG